MTPPQPRRKKWTEAEERSLIDKYGEMCSDGTLSKMKTREKKYKPIALHVNSMHHVRDPVSYPWRWTWKDVSTKVPNMRHQYNLVKEKIKNRESDEEFDWTDGITHWSNFLRYKEVFGDAHGGYDAIPLERHMADGDFVGGIEIGVMNLEFEYDGEGGEENFNNRSEGGFSREDGGSEFVRGDIDEPDSSGTRKRRRATEGIEKNAWGFLFDQLGRLREMESRFEDREMERERERERREKLKSETERERRRRREEMERDREARENDSEKSRRRWARELEGVERENEERERMRREEGSTREREWEERMERRRSEWKKRMDETLSRHRVEMGRVQARIEHDRRSFTSHLIGLVSEHSGDSGHYVSEMMQNLHNANGTVLDDAARVEGDDREDRFIVDG